MDRQHDVNASKKYLYELRETFDISTVLAAAAGGAEVAAVV